MTGAKRIPAFCTQCRSRCGCTAIVEDGRLLRIEPLASHPTGYKLCPKGRAAPELVYHKDRLTHPLRRTRSKSSADPAWVPISWDEALDEITARMRAIASEHGPEQVAFSVTTPSGSHIQDSIFWIERMIRAYGSPNTIYGTEICNWHKDFASRFTYGHDIGTPDFAATGCVLLWGNNPATTWLARATEVQAALKGGARMIVVDPRPTAFAKRADQWLQLRPGTDQVVALGLAHLMIAAKGFKRDFVTQWTNGPLLVRSDTGRLLRESDVSKQGRAYICYALDTSSGRLLRFDTARGLWPDEGQPALQAEIDLRLGDSNSHVRCRTAFDHYASAAAEYPPDRVAALTGVAPEALDNAAEILARAPSVAYYAWNGVGQSLTATQTDRAISTLYALTGSYGSQGGNVPGSAAPLVDISGQDLLSPAQRAKALGLSKRPLGPGASGWVTARDVYRAVLTAKPYPVRMLFSFGTNLLASQPDTALAQRALETLELHVHTDFFINATSRYADIVLPAATSWEREGLRAGFDSSLRSLRLMQLRPAVIAPIGEARADTDIVLALARRLGLTERLFGCDVDRGHDMMLAATGLTVSKLRSSPGGVELSASVPLDAHATMEADGTPKGFPTPSRRIEIYSEQLLDHGYRPVPSFDPDDATTGTDEFPLRLGMAKTVAYCHSQHRNIASLRRLAPDPMIELSPELAAQREVADGDWLRIRTSRGEAVARAKLVPGLASDTVFGQHGWWIDGPDGSPYDASRRLAANMNGAIDSTRSDPISGSLPLRCSFCQIEKL